MFLLVEHEVIGFVVVVTSNMFICIKQNHAVAKDSCSDAFTLPIM